MPTSRSYADQCGVARALDIVGERWALLVVRELLLGPRRFTDLRQSLPGASSNLITDRLRELARHGVINRRKLAPPASSWVYELTESGLGLEATVRALGDWGVRQPPPSGPTSLSTVSALLFLRSRSRPATDVRIQFDLDGQSWVVRGADQDEVSVTPGRSSDVDTTVRTDPVTLNELLYQPATLDATIARGQVTVTGKVSALRTLLHASTVRQLRNS